jgi:hypothetical protein
MSINVLTRQPSGPDPTELPAATVREPANGLRSS